MSIFDKYINIFHSFEVGNCVSNSSFKWMKNTHKQFSSTRVITDLKSKQLLLFAFASLKTTLHPSPPHVLPRATVSRRQDVIGSDTGFLAGPGAGGGVTLTDMCQRAAWRGLAKISALCQPWPVPGQPLMGLEGGILRLTLCLLGHIHPFRATAYCIGWLHGWKHPVNSFCVL